MNNDSPFAASSHAKITGMELRLKIYIGSLKVRVIIILLRSAYSSTYAYVYFLRPWEGGTVFATGNSTISKTV